MIYPVYYVQDSPPNLYYYIQKLHDKWFLINIIGSLSHVLPKCVIENPIHNDLNDFYIQYQNNCS